MGLFFQHCVSHQNNKKQLKNLCWRKQEEVGCHQLLEDKILQQMCISRCHVKHRECKCTWVIPQAQGGQAAGQILGAKIVVTLTISPLALYFAQVDSMVFLEEAVLESPEQKESILQKYFSLGLWHQKKEMVQHHFLSSREKSSKHFPFSLLF